MMNRENFEQLKAQTKETIARKNARAAELQEIIESCKKEIAEQSSLMEQAEQSDDPEAYQAAFSLKNMYAERLRKHETELGTMFRDPTLSVTEYGAVDAFVQAESHALCQETRAAVYEHLVAIKAILGETSAYYSELVALANLAEKANNAGYLGEFRLITVSSIPAHWTQDILGSMYYFRPDTQ